MSFCKTIIISPSGNFYGSEQVLFNFLSHTTQSYKIYVPRDSIFYRKLQIFNQHGVIGFGDIRWLYFKLFCQLFLGSYKSLYINEGGHVKYAKLIARILRPITVVLHIRLLEDCKANRLGQLPPNMVLVSVSDYISTHLKSYAHHKIYDPLDTLPIIGHAKSRNSQNFCIGIIGRVSGSKGLTYYNKFFEFISSNPFQFPLEFQFFGDIMKKDPAGKSFHEIYKNHKDFPVVFKGFESNQENLYSHLDLVLHLNPNEPLGRIGLESWARGIPFVCFNSGGSGEINQRLEMDSYSVDLIEGWQESLKVKIENIMEGTKSEDLEKARAGVSNFFSVSRYVIDLEQLFIS